ncbi:hypothetical protein R0K19_26810, partial [Bacillus sp. SIMBA_161]
VIMDAEILEQGRQYCRDHFGSNPDIGSLNVFFYLMKEEMEIPSWFTNRINNFPRFSQSLYSEFQVNSSYGDHNFKFKFGKE